VEGRDCGNAQADGRVNRRRRKATTGDDRLLTVIPHVCSPPRFRTTGRNHEDVVSRVRRRMRREPSAGEPRRVHREERFRGGELMLAVACPAEPIETASSSANGQPSALERGCDSVVIGDVNTKNATRIGPLLLVGVKEAARLPLRAFRPRHGRYSAVKVLVVVAGTSDATLTVPSSQRDSVRLLYDPSARSNRYGFRPSAAATSVTFRACTGEQTEYNGGFIAMAPVCAHLLVHSAGKTHDGWFSLGAATSCPA
jgi:hypothetical protein